MKNTPLEIFRNFFYQIMNGGITQPLAMNSSYRRDVVECLAEHNNSTTEVVNAVFEDVNWDGIDGELQDKLEQFICKVCELCEYCEDAEFGEECEECGGSGTIYEEEYDEEDNITGENEYACSACNGDGMVPSDIDHCDIDSLESYLPKPYNSYFNYLNNMGDELNEVFKLQSYSSVGGYVNGMKMDESLFGKILNNKKLKEESEWYVIRTGGSINDGEPKKMFCDSEEAAKEKARRMNKLLSPGEKKYYRIRYVARKLTESIDIDDLDFYADKVDDFFSGRGWESSTEVFEDGYGETTVYDYESDGRPSWFGALQEYTGIRVADSDMIDGEFVICWTVN